MSIDAKDRRVREAKRAVQETWAECKRREEAYAKEDTRANLKAAKDAYAVYEKRVDEFNAARDDLEAEMKAQLAKLGGGVSAKALDVSGGRELGEHVMRELRERKALDASAGGLTLPRGFYDPNFAELPQGRALVRSLLPTVQATGDRVAYVRQTVATQNAAAVAEGGLKPTSVYSSEKIEAEFATIAHVSEALPRSLLADWQAAVDFISGQMRLGVLLEEEDQILNGNGTPPNLEGLLTVTGTLTPTYISGDTAADTVYRAITTLRSNFVEPDGIVMNPADFAAIRLSKDAEERYLTAGIVADDPSRLWDTPVIQSTRMPAETILVGNFALGARLYERESGAAVRFTESGLNDAGNEMWTRNQIRWRAESRIQLGVLIPGAFCVADLGFYT